MILQLTRLENGQPMLIHAAHIVGIYEINDDWDIGKGTEYPPYTKIVTVNGGTWRSSDPFSGVAALWLDTIDGKREEE